MQDTADARKIPALEAIGRAGVPNLFQPLVRIDQDLLPGLGILELLSHNDPRFFQIFLCLTTVSLELLMGPRLRCGHSRHTWSLSQGRGETRNSPCIDIPPRFPMDFE